MLVYNPSGAKLALMNGSSLTKAFVALPGGATAAYNASGLQYYRHPDWLGSSRLATTTTRTNYYDAAYAPYGEPYAGAGATQDLSFTGQNQDTESSTVPGGAGGLYDFLYREHTPVQGRWLSPDPAGMAAASPNDPQSWNRYAYVGNRPLNNVDSLGNIELPVGGPGDGCDPDIFTDCGCDYFCPLDPPTDPSENGVLPLTVGIQPQRTGGVWPGNVTTGLPGGLNTSPLGLGDLLGLSPGTGCDFGDICSSPGNIFSAVSVPIEATVPLCVAHPELCILAGGLALQVAQEYLLQKLAEKIVKTILPDDCILWGEVTEHLLKKCIYSCPSGDKHSWLSALQICPETANSASLIPGP